MLYVQQLNLSKAENDVKKILHLTTLEHCRNKTYSCESLITCVVQLNFLHGEVDFIHYIMCLFLLSCDGLRYFLFGAITWLAAALLRLPQSSSLSSSQRTVLETKLSHIILSQKNKLLL